MDELVLAVNELESVTIAVKLNVPAVVGVPVMAPLLVLSVNPVGSAPTEIENR
jgi:hypothetical protein